MRIPGFLGKWFKPKSEFDKLVDLVGPVLVRSYRQIANERGIAPTAKTSDKEIVDLYILVESSFKNAAKKRQETIPQGYINHIVLHFYQVHEMFDNMESFRQQLDFELKRYLSDGLRKEFRIDLQLFTYE